MFQSFQSFQPPRSFDDAQGMLSPPRRGGEPAPDLIRGWRRGFERLERLEQLEQI
jgi:hypothetical protein